MSLSFPFTEHSLGAVTLNVIEKFFELSVLQTILSCKDFFPLDI